MSRPRSAVMSIRRYLVDFTKIRRITMYFLLMVFAVLLQRISAPQEPCSLLERAEGDTVNLDGCGLTNITRSDMELVPNITHLYLQDNYFIQLDPEVFSGNKELTHLYLGNNENLVVPEDTCFLHSDTIVLLNLSFTGVCAIKPSSMKCMPKLYRLVLVQVPSCEESKRLAELSNASYKVLCAGTASYDMTYPNGSLCPRRSEDTSSPLPDPVTPTEVTSREPELSTPTRASTASTASTTAAPHTPTPATRVFEDNGYVVILYIVYAIVGILVLALICFLVLFLIYKFKRETWETLKDHCTCLTPLERCFDCQGRNARTNGRQSPRKNADPSKEPLTAGSTPTMNDSRRDSTV